MSLFKIAWRSIQQRGLASALTMLSMALGVMLVVAVLSVHGVVTESFQNNSSLGYNLIVGAKGGKLQLTLNTVYYLSTPVENIPYDYYLEFFAADQRRQQLEHSVRRQVHTAQWQAIEASLLTDNAVVGMPALGSALAGPLLEQTAAAQLEFEREGKYQQFTSLAIPLCLGDYFGRFRVVGTTPDMFDTLTFGPALDQKYQFSQGRNFQHHSPQHGYFEAVLGATVAREMQVGLGQQISPSHGDPEGEGHAQKFTVVGILRPSGTPNDRAVFINMEGFYLMEDHAKPLADEEQDEPQPPEPEAPASDGAAAAADAPGHDHQHGDDHTQRQPLPVEQREVTAILLRTVSPIVGARLPNLINEGPVAQCVAPVREITNLFDSIVGPIQQALLLVTALVCVVSGIGILVSIYNSMSDRRHEIAVMRALGASRGTVMSVVLLEAVILSITAGLAGWVCAHGMNWAASPVIEARTGVAVGFFDMGPWYSLDPKALLAERLPGSSSQLVAWLARLAWGGLMLGGGVASVGVLLIYAGAFRRSLIWGVVCLLMPLALYVFAFVDWETSRLARKGFWWHLAGIFVAALSALYLYGVPLNIELVLIPALTLLAIVVGFLPAVAAYRTDVAESLGT